MKPPPTRRILFIHDSFPGQFGPWAAWLAARGWDVTFATRHPPALSPGYRLLTYAPHRPPAPGTHPYAQPMDRAVLTGQGFARAALALRDSGYRPDIIVAHSGWGAGLFAKDVFPQARLIAYAEWWYNHPGTDVAALAASDPAFAPQAADAPMVERARNAPLALDLGTADAILCPTQFQAAQFPPLFRNNMLICHDGIDTDYFCPGDGDRSLAGLVPPGAPVITYATRGMEPHRGFPQFMAALPVVLAQHPAARVLIAGDNRVSYGGHGVRAIDWKARALAADDLPPDRVHFTGNLTRGAYLALLRRSDAHIYLTVPFVLSWSMLEAMSTAAPLVLSDTAPVREFAGPAEARLVPTEPAAISAAISATLEANTAAQRAAARHAITSGPSFDHAMVRKARLLDEIAG